MMFVDFGFCFCLQNHEMGAVGLVWLHFQSVTSTTQHFRRKKAHFTQIPQLIICINNRLYFARIARAFANSLLLMLAVFRLCFDILLIHIPHQTILSLSLFGFSLKVFRLPITNYIVIQYIYRNDTIYNRFHCAHTLLRYFGKKTFSKQISKMGSKRFESI